MNEAPLDKRVWDKGTPFQSGPQVPVKESDDDVIWDSGTPFESRESK